MSTKDDERGHRGPLARGPRPRPGGKPQPRHASKAKGAPPERPAAAVAASPAPKPRRQVAVEGAATPVKKIVPRPIADILGDDKAVEAYEQAQALFETEGGGERPPAWDPVRIEQFLRGQITLGDLEGITKHEQYEMAKVGYSYLTSGKLDRARTVFEGLLALDPYDAYFHTALGSIAQQQSNLDEAEARYTRALEINPFSPVARAHRGEIRMLRGRVGEGAEDLIRALQEDPEGREPSTIRARATLQAVREQLEAAKENPQAAAAGSGGARPSGSGATARADANKTPSRVPAFGKAGPEVKVPSGGAQPRAQPPRGAKPPRPSATSPHASGPRGAPPVKKK